MSSLLLGGPVFVLLGGLIALVAVVVLAASAGLRRARATSADPGSSVAAPTGVGRIAYEVTVSVAALLVSGCLVLAALWVLAVGLLGTGLFFYSAQGGPPPWLPAVIIAALLGAIGLRLGYLARRHLLQI